MRTTRVKPVGIVPASGVKYSAWKRRIRPRFRPPDHHPVTAVDASVSAALAASVNAADKRIISSSGRIGHLRRDFADGVLLDRRTRARHAVHIIVPSRNAIDPPYFNLSRPLQVFSRNGFIPALRMAPGAILCRTMSCFSATATVQVDDNSITTHSAWILAIRSSASKTIRRSTTAPAAVLDGNGRPDPIGRTSGRSC